MPTGIYIRTTEHNEKIRLTLIANGIMPTKEAIELARIKRIGKQDSRKL